MPSKISKKVINIFAKHNKQLPLNEDEKVVKCEDGICCVCVKMDENGNYYDENHLIDRSNECQYIVRVMIKHLAHPYIYNYNVPGSKIQKFLADYINGKKEGRIIEIENYYPDDLA